MFENMLNKIQKYKIVSILVAIIFLLILVIGFFIVNLTFEPRKEESLITLGDSSVKKDYSKDDEPFSSQGKIETKNSKTIKVDVKGSVKKPGLYELPRNARVDDVLVLAGGLTESADYNSVNFSKKLTDEAVVYVATKDEKISVVPLESKEVTFDDNTVRNDQKTNLNMATQTELQQVSGIGSKRAQDIIDYRKKNGNFQSIDELLNISGIGPKMLEKIREELSID